MEAEFLQFCKDGDVEKVSLLLKEKRVNVNTPDGDGMSGLMHAGDWLMCQLVFIRSLYLCNNSNHSAGKHDRGPSFFNIIFI